MISIYKNNQIFNSRQWKWGLTSALMAQSIDRFTTKAMPSSAQSHCGSDHDEK